MSASEDLRQARQELERVQREKPDDRAAYEAANSKVVEAEGKVPFGRMRGWK